MSGGFGGVAEVLDGIEHARRAGPRADQDQHRRAARRQRSHACSTCWRISAAPASSCASSNTWTWARAITGTRRWSCRRASWRRRSRARWPLAPRDRDYRGEVAERYVFDDGAGEVGFISSVSQPFCGDCSRARISSDGSFYTCLFATQGTDLRAPLRAGATDDELYEIVRGVWTGRRDRYSELRASLRDATRAAQGRDELHRRLEMAAAQHAQAHASRSPPTARPWSTWAPRPRPCAKPAPRPSSNYRRPWRASWRAPGIARRRARCSTPPSSPASWPRRRPTRSCRSAIRCRSSAARWTSATAPGGRIRIVCSVAVHHKTGVEMEALVGASAAALTIYDMCKALSHDIEIGPVRLLSKTGGKRDFYAQATASAARAARRANDRMTPRRRLYGLVLAGGRSTRMQRDKAAIEYRPGETQLDAAMKLLGWPRRAQLRFRARGPARRSARARLAADRRSRRTSRAPSPASARRWPNIPTPPGWCWPAICPFSTRARSTR